MSIKKGRAAINVVVKSFKLHIAASACVQLLMTQLIWPEASSKSKQLCKPEGLNLWLFQRSTFHVKIFKTKT